MRLAAKADIERQRTVKSKVGLKPDFGLRSKNVGDVFLKLGSVWYKLE
jgi:hypothetical protein